MAQHRITKSAVILSFVSPKLRQLCLSLALFCLAVSLSGRSDTADKRTPPSNPNPTLPDSPNPFSQIQSIDVSEYGAENIQAVTFVVAAKPAALTPDFRFTYPQSSLPSYTEGQILKLPIFFLYENYTNQVRVISTLKNGSTRETQFSIPTGPYSDASSEINRAMKDLQISVPATQKPTFDFFLLKGHDKTETAYIYDIDGNIRWLAQGDSFIPARWDELNRDGIIIGFDTYGYHSEEKYLKYYLDGRVEEHSIIHPGKPYTKSAFHHTIDRSKGGRLLFQLYREWADGSRSIEDYLLEVDPTTDRVTNDWDLAEIVKTHIDEAGDPGYIGSDFVGLGKDWCHSNSVVYDQENDALIISCREDFVISIDYDSKDINWILGDKTKYWYTFPSLRSLALADSNAGSDYKAPIGQHTVSLDAGGDLLLFNNGAPSLPQNQRDGVDLGESYSSSYISKYSIDEQANTVRSKLSFTEGIPSPYCSSVYQDRGSEDYLITYTFKPNRRIVIYDKNFQTKKLEIQFRGNALGDCGDGFSWNSEIIRF